MVRTEKLLPAPTLMGCFGSPASNTDHNARTTSRTSEMSRRDSRLPTRSGAGWACRSRSATRCATSLITSPVFPGPVVMNSLARTMRRP